jgi:hypothetical protein
MNKTTYKPGTFADIYALPIGKDLWNLLNTEQVWEKLELTTYLKHPAAEGIGDVILAMFPSEFVQSSNRYHRMKQCTGHMIRQIMEANGYEMDKPKVKCHINKVFVYAARYRKGAIVKVSNNAG